MMPLPPPAVSWAGWYVGVNAGAAWQQMTGGNADPGSAGSANSAFSTPGSISGTAFIGGGQIGYNWQDGNFVYGLEGDFDGLAGSESFRQGQCDQQNTLQSKMNWLSTVRGRAGLAVGNTMAYMTGGVAIRASKTNLHQTASALPLSLTRKQTGRRLAGSSAVALTMLSANWTIGVEALFVDLGSNTLNTSFDGANKAAKFNNQVVIGRVKLNYKW